MYRDCSALDLLNTIEVTRAALKVRRPRQTKHLSVRLHREDPAAVTVLEVSVLV